MITDEMLDAVSDDVFDAPIGKKVTAVPWFAIPGVYEFLGIATQLLGQLNEQLNGPPLVIRIRVKDVFGI
jgi:hypothetical protein